MIFPKAALKALLFLNVVILSAGAVVAQDSESTSRAYPKTIRGYKVEQATVEVRNSKSDGSSAGLITFGEARVVRITPLGVTLELPIVVSPVKQKGRVDFLSFEDMSINDTAVEVDDYYSSFELPNDRPLVLQRPLVVFVGMPSALVGAVMDWASPREMWPVNGVVYVFGQFKKLIFKPKRVVPVELNLQMRNPLRATP
ncbi:MAG TPA: hypothetical protein VJ124_14315 [Pyrinomonadaceae bacterium]|nr:hypothetical protein [Pyrinomonadaceae bacterium]